jgi:ornithine cyclodeaminase/alanine dehydrogenase-like protein (mu-crystallin family)
MIRTLGAADIEQLLPMADAIDVAADAFRAISAREGEYPSRMHVAMAHGDALVMPGYDGQRHFGVKVVTVHPGNAARGKPGTRASYLLIDADDGEPRLLCDGTALTALRTGAASGLATRRLAAPDAGVLTIVGAGAQARAQVEAVCAVRKITDIHVVSRDAGRANAFIASLRARFPDLRIDRAMPEDAAPRAQVIVTATSSSNPVLMADWVRPGTHINAIGSYTPGMCELDPAVLAHARIFVDQRAAALAAAGEILAAIRMGLITSEALRELGETNDTARRTKEEVTVFKSVGHAALDLFTAAELLRRAGG